ncbi:MAG TPA: peptidoglycan-binding protein [Microthrixaceae bacterium]|nr:peptidoglycan-binding protein [Microthrixaceae bacterium]
MRDLTTRLRSLGFDTAGDATSYGDGTAAAVKEFQSSRGLDADGICDADTWAALVEAGYGLGDRLLYLTSPMSRGDDVARLQLQLGALGFDAGRVDGIFGPMTQRALLDFQQNVGLVADEVCGPDTVAALARLQPRAGLGTVAGVRERHLLRTQPRGLVGLRVALVHQGETDALVGTIGADLLRLGAQAAVLVDADWSALAQQVNEFDAGLCVALVVDQSAAQEICYFETEGFSSDGGRRLGSLVLAEFPTTPTWTIGVLKGMRLPILRETRPPTVVVRIGPPAEVLEHRALLASALGRAITRWASEPY